MNILVLGSGGREYALAWKISQSKSVNKIYIAPGNAGTNDIGENLAINIADFNAVKENVLNLNIEMVVVGPEQPLVDGIVDFFKNDADLKNIKIIGPDKKGAQLEGSKAFAKAFMEKFNINKMIPIIIPNTRYGLKVLIALFFFCLFIFFFPFAI